MAGAPVIFGVAQEWSTVSGGVGVYPLSRGEPRRSGRPYHSTSPAAEATSLAGEATSWAAEAASPAAEATSRAT